MIRSIVVISVPPRRGPKGIEPASRYTFIKSNTYLPADAWTSWGARHPEILVELSMGEAPLRQGAR